MRVRGRRRRADRGAAAVETALVLPLMLLVVFAIIDFGRMLNTQIKVTEATREGGRALSLMGETTATTNATIVMGSDPVGGSPTTPDGGQWQGLVISDCEQPGDVTAEYQINYAFDFITPLGVLVGLTANENVILDARAVMPCRA